MKLLTALVNGRIDHTLNFDSLYPYPNSYIAQISSSTSVNLMKFNSPSNKCVIFTDTENATYDITNIYLTEEEGAKNGDYNVKNITFVLSLHKNGAPRNGSSNGNNPNCSRGTDIIRNNKYWSNNSLTLPIQGYCVYNVTIKFDINDITENKYAVVKINVAPKECIWDVVLDYGSEASQLLVSKRSQNNTINDICVLFDEFYMAHNNNIPNCDNNGDVRTHYIQYDQDNKHYYKSLFYIKRKFSQGEKIGVNTPLGKLNDDILLLNLYSNLQNEKKDYMIVPNLKIANHGGVILPNIDYGGNYTTAPQIGERDVYRKIVNAFMQIAIKRTRLSDGTPRFLNVILLVPNTYRQDEVSKVLTHLASDIITLSSSNGDTTTTVDGVEVSSISESDASFVGIKHFMQDSTVLKSQTGKYLIMDAGKGTLDFSVIEDNINNHTGYRYNSAFRAGIIGAGNSISYSVLLAIINHIFLTNDELAKDENKRKKAITEFVNNNILATNADLAEVTNLMRNVERYKRLYNDGLLKSSGISQPNAAQVQSITALNNLIVNMCEHKILVRDESYINNMIDNICFAVSKKLGCYYPTQAKYKIDHIIFAGRGFLMNKLRNRMEEVLKKYNKSICGDAKVHKFEDLVNTANTVTPKNICMFIINAIRDGKYNGHLVGIPYIALDTSENQSSTTTPNGEAKKKQTIPFADKFKDGIGWLIEQMFGTSYKENSEKGVVTNHCDIVAGCKDIIKDNNDVLVVSGMFYNINMQLRDNTERVPVRIFFDGIDFVVRREQWLGRPSEVIEINPHNRLDGNYVFESTFPFLLTNQSGEIPFPRKVEEYTQEPEVEKQDTNEQDDLYEQQIHQHKNRNNQ